MTTKEFTYTTYVRHTEIFSKHDWDTTISGALLLSFRDLEKKVEKINYVLDLTTIKIYTEWGQTEGVEEPTFNLYISAQANDYENVDTETQEW